MRMKILDHLFSISKYAQKGMSALTTRLNKSLSQGAYEAASYGRRIGTWGTYSGGPNTSLFSSLSAMRARSRELTRMLIFKYSDTHFFNF